MLSLVLIRQNLLASYLSLDAFGQLGLLFFVFRFGEWLKVFEVKYVGGLPTTVC